MYIDPLVLVGLGAVGNAYSSGKAYKGAEYDVRKDLAHDLRELFFYPLEMDWDERNGT